MKRAKFLVCIVLMIVGLLVWFNCNPMQSDNNTSSSLNILDEADTVKATGSTIYVTPSGSSSAGGTSFSDAKDIKSAITNATAGQTVLLQAGTYKIAYSSGSKNTITLSKAGSSSSRITIEGSGGKAVINFQFPTNAWVQDSYGLYVTGSYYTFKNIDITNAGYQGCYVTGGYNNFETVRFYKNRNSGLEINKGGNNSIVRYCDSYENFDLKNNGEMSDGFAIKQTVGSGNKFYNCKAWSNSDDAWDFYDTTQVMTLENCTADSSGKGDGNGQGFKLGGLNKKASHTLLNCSANNNKAYGYHANNNPGPIYLTNCTGSGNGSGLYGQKEALVIK